MFGQYCLQSPAGGIAPKFQQYIVLLLASLGLEQCFSTFRILQTTETKIAIIVDHMQPPSPTYKNYI